MTGRRAALPSSLWQPEGSREGWRPYRLPRARPAPAARNEPTRAVSGNRARGGFEPGSWARLEGRVLVPPSPRAVHGRPPQGRPPPEGAIPFLSVHFTHERERTHSR